MIYFDNAATSYPKPPSVLAALTESLSRYGGNPGRGSHALALSAAEAIYRTREEIADFLHAPAPENLIFCQNATMAINLALKTRARRGDHILISDREHNAVLRPVDRLHREGLCRYDIFQAAGDVLKNIAAACRPSTRILLCTHVSNVTGKQLPVAEIGAFCRRRGIYFILDASQSVGHLPIDLGTLPCDAFCAPGHKGLYGMMGAGFLILRSPQGLSEYIEGGSGVNSLSPHMPKELPERYEAGTLPTPAILSIGAGIRTLREVGVEAIEAHETRLRSLLVEGLSAFPTVTVYEPQNRGGVLSFADREKDPEQIGASLDEAGICVRCGFHCAPLAHRALGTEARGGTVRLSLGMYNTEGEVESFLRALRRILPT